MSTTINVIGTIATDPRLVHPASGVPLCSFRLASDERRYDKERKEWVEGHTNWFGVVCFRSLAAHAHESFKKGDRVIVSGKLKIRKWEKDEKKGTSVEIEAEAIGHDLRWGITKFEKRLGANTDSSLRATDQGDGFMPDSGAETASPFASSPADSEQEQAHYAQTAA